MDDETREMLTRATLLNERGVRSNDHDIEVRKYFASLQARYNDVQADWDELYTMERKKAAR